MQTLSQPADDDESPEAKRLCALFGDSLLRIRGEHAEDPRLTSTIDLINTYVCKHGVLPLISLDPELREASTYLQAHGHFTDTSVTSHFKATPQGIDFLALVEEQVKANRRFFCSAAVLGVASLFSAGIGGLLDLSGCNLKNPRDQKKNADLARGFHGAAGAGGIGAVVMAVLARTHTAQELDTAVTDFCRNYEPIIGAIAEETLQREQAGQRSV